MTFLFDWFGRDSTKVLDKAIKQEIKLLQDLLHELEDVDKILAKPLGRKYKLTQILKKEKGILGKVLKIENTIHQILHPYIKGEKKPKKGLAYILILDDMLREFKNHELWTELKELWKQELNLLKTNLNPRQLEMLKQNLHQQQHIAMILKKLCEFEFYETHTHLGPAVDADNHWKYLVRHWKLALGESVPTDPEVFDRFKQFNIIQAFKEHAKTSQTASADVRKINTIMSNYLSGKWTETKAFVEFNKLILMVDTGTFTAFQEKASILNIIQTCGHQEPKFQRKYYLDAMDNAVRHNLKHNVVHMEIRFPIDDRERMEFFASVAREIELKHNNKITIRFVHFAMRSMDPMIFIAMYKKLPARLKKYVVGLDMSGKTNVDEFIALAKKSPVPLCVHAGELYTPRHHPGLNRAQSVEKALHQVRRCVDSKNIYRIGHATIIGTDLKKYLARSDPKTAQRLCALQQRLIKDIVRKGIIIEANPSSNIKIAGIKYKDHPIKVFSEESIRFAISTDDRVSFDTNMKKEFYLMARAMEWKADELKFAAQMQKEAALK